MKGCAGMPAMLVVLSAGLPEHADAPERADLCGPLSLFGESALLFGEAAIPFLPALSGCGPRARAPADSPRRRAYAEAAILWPDQAPEGPGQIGPKPDAVPAGSTPDAGPAGPSPDVGRAELAVPAVTFLTGPCASTFSVAWALCEDGLLPEWGAVLSSSQKEGRGRMRRPWHSPRGNLYVTFRLPDDPLLKGDAASLLTGYVMLLAFAALGFPLRLKWPNDLLLGRDRKVGGILLEERDGVLLAGMGVNLAEAPGDLRAGAAIPAGLLRPGDARPGFARLARELAPFFLWQGLAGRAVLIHERRVRGRPAEALFAAMNDVLAWRGEEVLLRDAAEGPARGRCLGLGPGGGIVLGLPHGEDKEFFSGSLMLA